MHHAVLGRIAGSTDRDDGRPSSPTYMTVRPPPQLRVLFIINADQGVSGNSYRASGRYAGMRTKFFCAMVVRLTAKIAAVVNDRNDLGASVANYSFPPA